MKLHMRILSFFVLAGLLLSACGAVASAAQATQPAASALPDLQGKTI